jgi:hypothetical protein
MEFRWVAFIALWTVLSGPVFASPAGRRERAVPAGAARKVATDKPFSSERNSPRLPQR